MEIIDAAINHQFVMIRKEGKGELIDSSNQLAGENICKKFTWMVNSEYGTIFRKRKHFKNERAMAMEFLRLVNDSKGTVDLIRSTVNFSGNILVLKLSVTELIITKID
jgi:hypothetical protein